MSEFKRKFGEAGSWIDKFKEGVENYHKVYDIYTEFGEYDSLMDNIPESEKELLDELEAKLLEPLSLFVNSLGPTLDIKTSELEFSGTTASSGSAFFLNEIQNYTAKDNLWLTQFRNNAFSVVQNIQNEKESVSYIKAQLHYLFEPLGKEFDELLEIRNKYLATIEYASSFGIKMRNVLEHFKGVCSKCAVIEKFGVFRELRDPLTWSKISECVAIGGIGSKYENQFSKNAAIYINIHSTLSQDAKDYCVNDIEKLPNTFIKTIQYLESSLRLIDLEKIKNSL